MAITIDGAPVLTLLPDPPDSWPEGLALPGAVAGTPGGNVVTTTLPDRYPTTTHALAWTCLTRAALAAVEAFLHARRGAFGPWWLPVVRRDATLVEIAGSDWTVRAAGFAAALFPDPTQRKIAAIGPRRASQYVAAWRINTAEDNGDGTDTWNVSPEGSEGVGATAPGAFLCQLARVHLVDGWTVSFPHGGVARVTADAVEVPA